MHYWQYSLNGKMTLILSIIVIMSISIFLGIFLRKKSERAKNIPLILVTIILLILELIKQIRSAVIGSYDWWTVPLHFCSLFIYFFPLAVFSKGKVKEFGQTMSLVCCCWLTILFYINPEGIIGSSPEHVFADFGSFHTYFYHHLAILFLFLSVSLNVYKINKRSFIYVVLGITIYGLIASTMANITNTNYCNLVESNIPFMETFRQNVGQIIYTFSMWLIGIFGGWAVCLVYLGIDKFKKRGEVI